MSNGRAITVRAVQASALAGAAVLSMLSGTAQFGASPAPAVVQQVNATTVSSTCPTPATYVRRATPATRRRTVALTFDDGPSKNTPYVLAALKRNGVRGTFFMIGKAVRSQSTYGKMVVADGNVIGNITWSHPMPSSGGSFARLTTAQQTLQIDEANQVLATYLGVRPCFFRAPGGSDSSPITMRLARNRGMTVVNWTYDSLDWTSPQSWSSAFQRGIVARAVGSNPHPIILMHDGGTTQYRINTAASLDRIIAYYRTRGYAFTDPNGRVLPVVAKSVSLTSSVSTGRMGQSIRLSGSTAAIQDGTRVYVQKSVDRKWVTVRMATVSALNTYTVSIPLATGANYFRAVSASQASRTVTVVAR